jgi:dynein heavy chain
VPEFDQPDEYLEHIMGLPLLTPPQVFGFHPNADITKDMIETNQVFDSLLCPSEGGGQAGQSFQSTLEQLVHTIMSDFLDEFDERELWLCTPSTLRNP